ncbi:unnamed protein product [Rotaria socialis]|uniref:Uncharacterized protein n=1 Tax=Rotaria socialis TaxID=392032 RepID=A0A818UWL3_9BILA|nr:unnamed protein product [Rotaria socialis]CAF4531125.1 unnamed protein product [Rotaria socialis]
MSTPTSRKQRQIGSCFQSKNQKTCEAARNHADNSNNPIDLVDDEENVNPVQEFMSPELTESSRIFSGSSDLPCFPPEYGDFFPSFQSILTVSGNRNDRPGYASGNLSHFKSTNDKRKCQLGWFNKHDCLSYCQSHGKVYCYYCRNASHDGYHPHANKVPDDLLTTRGFNFWKNALAKIHSYLKPITMARWEIRKQDSGITDIMKTNILSTISTAIDMHGSSEKFEVAKVVSDWLDETYGKYWAVIIYDTGHAQAAKTTFGSKYLVVEEKRLAWSFQIFKQANS